jgi:hypothetical protein
VKPENAGRAARVASANATNVGNSSATVVDINTILFKSPLCSVPIHFDGASTVALLDTGAQVNVMSKATYDSINNKPPLLKAKDVNLNGIGQLKVPHFGIIEIDFTISNKALYHTYTTPKPIVFLIVEKLSHPVILAMTGFEHAVESINAITKKPMWRKDTIDGMQEAENESTVVNSTFCRPSLW